MTRGSLTDTLGGFACPTCRDRHSFVRDSRPTKEGYETIRRRRQCKACGERYSTIEILGTTHGGHPILTEENLNGVVRQLELLTERVRAFIPTAEEDLPR